MHYKKGDTHNTTMESMGHVHSQQPHRESVESDEDSSALTEFSLQALCCDEVEAASRVQLVSKRRGGRQAAKDNHAAEAEATETVNHRKSVVFATVKEVNTTQGQRGVRDLPSQTVR